MSDTYEDDDYRHRRKGQRDDPPLPPPAFYEPVAYRSGCVDGRALDAADLRRLFDGLLLLSDHLRWTFTADGESRATRTLEEREVVWRAANGAPTQAKVCAALSALAARHDITLFPAFRAMPAPLRHAVASYLDARAAGAFARTSQAARTLVSAAAPGGGFGFLDAVRPAVPLAGWPLAALTPTLADDRTTPDLAAAYRLLGALAVAASRPDSALRRAFGAGRAGRDGWVPSEMSVYATQPSAERTTPPSFVYDELHLSAALDARDARLVHFVAGGKPSRTVERPFEPDRDIRDGRLALPESWSGARARWMPLTTEGAMAALAALLVPRARRSVVLTFGADFIEDLGADGASAWLPPAMVRDLTARAAQSDAADAAALAADAREAEDRAARKALPLLAPLKARGFPTDMAIEMVNQRAIADPRRFQEFLLALAELDKLRRPDPRFVAHGRHHAKIPFVHHLAHDEV